MRAITTLQQLIEGGYQITAHCAICQHSSRLDLPDLAERLGNDFVTVGDPNPLAARLRCEKCREKEIGLILTPPAVPTPGLGLYGKNLR